MCPLAGESVLPLFLWSSFFPDPGAVRSTVVDAVSQAVRRSRCGRAAGVDYRGGETSQDGALFGPGTGGGGQHGSRTRRGVPDRQPTAGSGSPEAGASGEIGGYSSTEELRAGRPEAGDQGGSLRAREAVQTSARVLRTILDRLIRGIGRKGRLWGLERLARTRLQAERLCSQTPKERNKLYSWHAPEVECIGKVKARQPYGFGVKVGIAITARSGLIMGARSFPGNP